MNSLSSSITKNQHLIELEIDDVESFECFADNFSFKCVWQQSDVNLRIINQFMEEMNIYDSNEFGDYTPSDILELLSSSFPSGSFDNPIVEAGEKSSNELSFASTLVTLISSTPILKGRRNMKAKFQGDSSPILSPTDLDRRLLPRKRLQMSFEQDGDEDNENLIKV